MKIKKITYFYEIHKLYFLYKAVILSFMI